MKTLWGNGEKPTETNEEKAKMMLGFSLLYLGIPGGYSDEDSPLLASPRTPTFQVL